MNLQVVHTSRNRRIILFQQVFIRGSPPHTVVIETSKVIAFYLREIADQLRDFHRHAPIFRLPGKVGRGIALARGRTVVACVEPRLSARKRLDMMEFGI